MTTIRQTVFFIILLLLLLFVFLLDTQIMSPGVTWTTRRAWSPHKGGRSITMTLAIALESSDLLIYSFIPATRGLLAGPACLVPSYSKVIHHHDSLEISL